MDWCQQNLIMMCPLLFWTVLLSVKCLWLRLAGPSFNEGCNDVFRTFKPPAHPKPSVFFYLEHRFRRQRSRWHRWPWDGEMKKMALDRSIQLNNSCGRYVSLQINIPFYTLVKLSKSATKRIPKTSSQQDSGWLDTVGVRNVHCRCLCACIIIWPLVPFTVEMRCG